MRIDSEFVKKWSQYYDDRFYGSRDQLEEEAIRGFLSKQSEPKHLNKEYFVRLGRWKTKRQTSKYESNNEDKIIEATQSAYREKEPLIKLNILRTLRGVGITVAATILHYLHPEVFPIFDYHARNALSEGGYWRRSKDDASDQAWLYYVSVMEKLSKQLDVTLRELDKALFAYDKYGHANNYSIGNISSDILLVKTEIIGEAGLVPERRRKTMELRPETLDYYVGRARDILIDVARGNRERRFITYGELMDEMGGPGRGYIAEVLEQVCCSEYERGHPLLSALVVHSSDGLPGYGFWYVRVLPDRVRNSSDEEKRVFWLQECDRVREFWRQH